MELPDKDNKFPIGLECLQWMNANLHENWGTNSFRVKKLNKEWGFDQKIVKFEEPIKIDGTPVKELNLNFGFHKSDFESWYETWTTNKTGKYCEDFQRFFLGYMVACGSRYNRYQEIRLEKIIEMKDEINKLKEQGKIPVKSFEISLIHHCYCKFYDTI